MKRENILEFELLWLSHVQMVDWTSSKLQMLISPETLNDE